MSSYISYITMTFWHVMSCCDGFLVGIIHQLRYGQGRNRPRRRAGQQVQTQRALVESWINQHGLL